MAAAIRKIDLNNSDLDALLQRATKPNAELHYAGDVSAAECYEFLKSHTGALLIDVRTQPEWAFVGVPDVTATSAIFAPISWRVYPTMALNPYFLEQLQAANATPETPIFFLCRTGGRSLDAALAMTEAGFHYCFNVAQGFEGDMNDASQRGAKNGWKATNLPWKQS